MEEFTANAKKEKEIVRKVRKKFKRWKIGRWIVLLFVAIIALMMPGMLSACGGGWRTTSMPTPAPTQIRERVKTVIAGASDSFVIMEDGSLWVWGKETLVSGEGGTVWDVEVRHRHIETLNDVVAVTSGQSNTMALTSDGILWAWGSDVYALPGIHSISGISVSDASVSIPVRIMDDVIAMSANKLRAAALKSDNTLWAWEHPFRVDIDDDTENRSNPKIVMGDVAAVFMGADRLDIMMITSDNTLWAWDGLFHSDVDDFGNAIRTILPSRIDRVMDDVRSVSVGHQDSTMILGSDGTLWDWAGDFDLSPNEDYTIWNQYPILDRVLDDVVTVSSNNDRTMAITSDGVLWAWGSNSQGQLGDGTKNDRDNPVKIMNDVIDVSIGAHHTMAITADGALWAWGSNQSGLQAGWLGDGTMTSRRSPTRIIDNIICVSAGSYHSMAIAADGSLWAWGDNTYGQLGTGTNRGEREQRPYRGLLPSTWLRPIIILEYTSE